MDRPVRVVRSYETATWQAQAQGTEQSRTSDWYWVTTLSPAKADTRMLVELGHRRWAIENQGFNELVQRWHVDHLFRHHPTAILCFWLMAMMAYNVFHAFVDRQIRPALRLRHTCLHWASRIAADFYGSTEVDLWQLPP